MMIIKEKVEVEGIRGELMRLIMRGSMSFSIYLCIAV